LYSDGLIEAFDPEGREFGAERLAASVERTRDRDLQASLTGLVDEVYAWTGRPIADDISALAVEIL
jgi:serine phosphatase RsbU (regulator of sigma subunit)